MRRNDFVLAAMSATKGQFFKPVQVQKFFFVLDKEIPELIEGPHFDFEPYDFGPFDKDVYQELDSLSEKGMLEISGASWERTRQYRITQEGLTVGSGYFDEFPVSAQNYIQSLVKWILPLSFTQLVSEVYRIYPDMKVNSLFQKSQ